MNDPQSRPASARPVSACAEPGCEGDAALHAEIAEALRTGELDPIARADLASEALDLAEAEARVRRPRIGWARPLLGSAAVVLLGVGLFLATRGPQEVPTAGGDEAEPQAVATGSVAAQRKANLAFLMEPETQARITQVPAGHWIGIQHGSTLRSADALGKLDVLLKKAELPAGTEDPQLARPRALHRFTFRKGTEGERAYRTYFGRPPFVGTVLIRDVGIGIASTGDELEYTARGTEATFRVPSRQGQGAELPMVLGEPGSMGGVEVRAGFSTGSEAPLVLPNGMGFPRFEIPGRATLEGGADHPGRFRRYMASLSIPQLGIRERFVEAIGNAEILERDDGTLRLGGATWAPYEDRLLASALDAKKPVLLLERQRWMVGFPGDPFRGLPVEGVRKALEPYVLAWRELPDRATWVGSGDDAPPAEARLTLIDPANPERILRQLVVRSWTRPAHVRTFLVAGRRAWEPVLDAVPQREKNERDVVRVLRDIHRAQQNAKQQVVIDTDGDGQGEYATLLELTGVSAGRRAERLRPPLIPNAYAPKPAHHGDLVIVGYRVRLFFPGRQLREIEPDREMRGHAVAYESASTFITQPRADAENVDVDQAEQHWWAYAWPEQLEVTGQRTFYVDQDGGIWATEPWVGAYEGSEAAPPADAAFASPGRYPGGVSPALVSADGHRWRQVP